MQIIKTISRVERLGCTVNGNPRHRIGFTDGTSSLVSSDAAVGYQIGNPGMREGSTVAVTFTRAGRIAYMGAVKS